MSSPGLQLHNELLAMNSRVPSQEMDSLTFLIYTN